MNLNITPIKTPTFKGRQEYKAIRAIPNMPCACCGKKVIRPYDFSTFFEHVSKPLKTMLEKGFFANWSKDVNIMNILTTWAEEEPTSTFDTIINKHSGRYATLREAVENSFAKSSKLEALGQIEINRNVSNLFNDLCSKARAMLRGSAVVMKYMAQFKDSLSDQKLEAFKQFEIYASKYPRKTLSEIVNMKEVYEFHAAKDRLQRAESREKLEYHFGNIAKILQKTKSFSEDEIYEMRHSAEEMYCTERDNNARVQMVKDMYSEALRSKNFDKLIPKVIAELEEVPETFLTKDSFFVYAHNHAFSDSKIIESLLVPSLSSFEHIIPRSKGGADTARNGIILCSGCNEKRKTRPYKEFLRYHTEMPANTDKQINYVAGLILKGQLHGAFRYWPVEVAETLERYTDGGIKPDITEYCIKEQKRSQKRMAESDTQLNRLKDRQSSEIMKKLKFQKEINSTISEITADLREVKEQRHRDKILSEMLSKHLNKHKD